MTISAREPVCGDHLEDAVRADPEVVVAEPADEIRRERRADLVPLDEQIVVAEPVPFREPQSADSVTKRSPGSGFRGLARGSRLRSPAAGRSAETA